MCVLLRWFFLSTPTLGSERLEGRMVLRCITWSGCSASLREKDPKEDCFCRLVLVSAVAGFLGDGTVGGVTFLFLMGL